MTDPSMARLLIDAMNALSECRDERFQAGDSHLADLLSEAASTTAHAYLYLLERRNVS
jgi:hypothetical protein